MPTPLLRRPLAGVLPWMLLVLLAFVPAHAQTAGETPLDRVRRIKQLQREMVTREGRERIEHARRRMAQARLDRDRQSPKAHHGEAELESDGESGERHGGERFELREPRDRRARALVESRLGASLAPNVRATDPAGDDSDASQNEPSIAVKDNHVLVAFNDLPGQFFGGSTQGYAFSSDGGATFTDGGEVPPPNDTTFWASDPVLTVNEATGEFYYIGLVETTEDLITGASLNGIAIMRATVGSVVAWDTPHIVVEESSATHFIDKPWVTIDPATDILYLTYTEYTEFGNSIIFTKSPNRGIDWSARLVLNPDDANGKVQGARPAVGPNGELYIVWKEIGPELPGSDFMRIRVSGDHGATFDVQRNVATVFDNYGTGAPGFNRERGVALPSIAVDRTTGPNRGRVYVTWNESLNWYDDVPPSSAAVNEIENNDFFDRAVPFTVGQSLSGAFRDSTGFGDFDLDYYRFNALQGASYVFWSDNVPSSLYTMRVFCSDTLTRLAFSGQLDAPIDTQGNQSILVWTCPRSGVYYLRMAYVEGGFLGPYHVRSGLADPGPGDRGRDQRDVFVTSSIDGVNWTDPERVNDDAPLFDNWLPEVAASGFGTVYTIWYDWRDAPASTCAGVSQIHIASSDDGGASWSPLGPLTTAASTWSDVLSNLAPNQGDYAALFSNENGVYAAWTDGRSGNPDIFTAAITALPESLQVSATAAASTGLITVSWQFRVERVVHANLYRQVADGPAVLVGPIDSDGSGNIVYHDSDVETGTRYRYSLGIDSGGTEIRVGLVTAIAPVGRLLARPNPLTLTTTIQYDVTSPGGPVELTIYDLQGRTISMPVRGNQTPGPKQITWEARDLHGNPVKPGLYLVRLTQGGQSSTLRISLIP